MKRNVVFIFLWTIFLLVSCEESTQCECVRAKAQALEASRKSGYNPLPTVTDHPACEQHFESIKGKSERDLKDIDEKEKHCEAYEDLKKEQKLFEEHLDKMIETMKLIESMD